ncbi:MAG: hypothetical protein QOC81_599 [Thermoanaerobaculia bacterium]|nr:hypothetical protein [Thermoanaerobaculia bacterium]
METTPIMRLLTTRLIVLSFLLGSIAHAQTHLQPTISSKPVYDTEVMPVVESSLSKMWESADAVVEVRIDSSEVKGIDRPGIAGRPQLPHVRTYHTSEVLRVIKGDVGKRSTIVFTQSAGQLELPDKIIRVADVEPLPSGERYVVFLRRPNSAGPWILLGERDGAFRLREGRVQPQGFGPVAREQANVTERQFGDQLERVAVRSPKPKV